MYSFRQWLGEKGETTVFPVQNQDSLTKEEAKNGYRDRLLASFDRTVDTGTLLTFRTFMSDSA